MIGVIALKLAELHNCPDHKAFRAAFTKSAEEPTLIENNPKTSGWTHIM
jgi:hypothetical protein